MSKTMRWQIYVSVVSCLLFYACTSVTPVPTDDLETSTPTVMVSTTPTNVEPTAATTQETEQSKDTGQDCPPPSKTVDIAPQYYAPAAGKSPVWAIINKPILVFSMSEDRESPPTEHGYPYKVLWVVEKNFSDKVMLQGGNLEDGTPLWFQIAGGEPTRNPTIDPLNPGAYNNPDYSDFPSYLFIPGPGCYFIEASWDKESWQINLSVTE